MVLFGATVGCCIVQCQEPHPEEHVQMKAGGDLCDSCVSDVSPKTHSESILRSGQI